MKYLTGFLLSFFFANNLFASNLCDSSCDLSITFPDGGSIAAVEALSITFGEGAFVNNGVVITGYSAGDVLSLSAGEIINFQNNGSFELGGGNIDYSDILIISNGVVNLAAVEGDKKIFIYNMTLLGSAALNVSSDVEVNENGLLHIFGGLVTVSTGSAITNDGSVSGLFVFEKATLTFEDEIFDITSSVLIEVDGQLSLTSKEVVINEMAATASEVSPGEAGVKESATVDSESVSASAGAGLISLSSMLFMSVLLVSLRPQSLSSKKKPGKI
jgi:hypothetical protein